MSIYDKTRVLCALAYAKINLFLDVTGRREDGYHTVELIMQAIDLRDELRFAVRGTPGDMLRLGDAGGDGRFPGVEADERNLVLRAVRALRERYGERFPADAGLDITLEKRIPSQAGLGGGSADAAAALLAVDRLFSLGLTEQELAETALTLGADVPFCLRGGTMRAEGIGERLTPLSPLPDCGIVVVKPHGGASTRAIYEAIDSAQPAHPDLAAMERALCGSDGREPFQAVAEEIADGRANAMQPVTAGFVPAVTELVRRLLDAGARAAQMSGSGSAVFGLFEDRELARRAMERLREETRQADVQGIFLTRPLTAEEIARERFF